MKSSPTSLPSVTKTDGDDESSGTLVTSQNSMLTATSKNSVLKRSMSSSRFLHFRDQAPITSLAEVYSSGHDLEGREVTVIHPPPAPYWKDLRAHLNVLNIDLEEYFPTIPASELDPVMDMAELTRLFKELSKLDDETRFKDHQVLARENSKLAIMRLAAWQFQEPESKEAKKTPVAEHFKMLGVVTCIILGMIYSGAESFSGATDLFGDFLGIAEPITFTFSIVFAVMSNLLFFALEAKGFMIEAGISSPYNITAAVQIAKDKLDETHKFSQALRMPDDQFEAVRTLPAYQSNEKLLRLFQEDIKKEHEKLTKKDSFFFKYLLPAVKYTFSISGATLFCFTGIMIGKDIIGNIAALSFGVALSTPVSIVVVAILAAAGFALFYSLQHRSVFNLFDAFAGRPKELLDEQKAFTDDIDNANLNIATNIQKMGLKKHIIKFRQAIPPICTDNKYDLVIKEEESPTSSPISGCHLNLGLFSPRPSAPTNTPLAGEPQSAIARTPSPH
jgi:hypothetical protein